MVLTIAFAISSLSWEPPRALRCLQPHLIGEYKSKDFFQHLVNYMTSGPIFITVWSGDNAIAIARQMAGATDPLEAAPGSIRGRYGLCMPMNTVHCSDSIEAAEREIALFFKDDEIFEW